MHLPKVGVGVSVACDTLVALGANNGLDLTVDEVVERLDVLPHQAPHLSLSTAGQQCHDRYWIVVRESAEAGLKLSIGVSRSAGVVISRLEFRSLTICSGGTVRYSEPFKSNNSNVNCYVQDMISAYD